MLNVSREPKPIAPWSWRAAAAFAVVVLVGHALLAMVGLFEGRSLFDRGLDSDSMFAHHWLADIDASDVNRVALATTLVTLCVLVAMHRGVAGGWRRLLLGWGWTVATFLSLVLPGTLSLYVVPFLLPLALFRAGWPELSIVLLAAAGLVVGLATLRYGRVTGPGCSACGRISPGRSSQQRLVRAAKLAAYAAALAPMGYAVVRLSWAAGIPVGTTTDFLRTINEANAGHGTVIMEVALAGMAIAGGVLCWGLTRPWSRRWPRWIPALHGRPVPRWFPFGMGIVCGAGLSGYATMLIPGVLDFISGHEARFPGTDVPMTWMSHVPSISLILWAPLVVLATVLFGYATRAECVWCRDAGEVTARKLPRTEPRCHANGAPLPGS